MSVPNKNKDIQGLLKRGSYKFKMMKIVRGLQNRVFNIFLIAVPISALSPSSQIKANQSQLQQDLRLEQGQAKKRILALWNRVKEVSETKEVLVEKITEPLSPLINEGHHKARRFMRNDENGQIYKQVSIRTNRTRPINAKGDILLPPELLKQHQIQEDMMEQGLSLPLKWHYEESASCIIIRLSQPDAGEDLLDMLERISCKSEEDKESWLKEWFPGILNLSLSLSKQELLHFDIKTENTVWSDTLRRFVLIDFNGYLDINESTIEYCLNEGLFLAVETLVTLFYTVEEYDEEWIKGLKAVQEEIQVGSKSQAFSYLVKAEKKGRKECLEPLENIKNPQVVSFIKEIIEIIRQDCVTKEWLPEQKGHDRLRALYRHELMVNCYA